MILMACSRSERVALNPRFVDTPSVNNSCFNRAATSGVVTVGCSDDVVSGDDNDDDSALNATVSLGTDSDGMGCV